MNIEDLRKIANTLPGTTEDIKWENHLCFNIGGKMYLVTSPDSVPVSASLKTTPGLFEELTGREGIIPAPYMARNMWVHIDDIGRMGTEEWKELVKLSYELVLSKLPAKFRKELAD
ncbi:MAG: MmcQ/YjbR family DNA-binding protein [Bacteroidota bacterium]